jgi:hypothetical protein
MTYRGHVRNGQITLDEPAPLPEGAEVNVQLMNHGDGKPSRHPSRHEILQMTLEQRRQVLALQSERLVESYQFDPERADWQGGDILE